MLPGREAELGVLCSSVAEVSRTYGPVVVVHGGGPQTTALMKSLGQNPTIVEGRRVTDAAALSSLVMAVCGGVSVRLTAALVGAGVRAVGINGVSARCLLCTKEPPGDVRGRFVDYGYVGQVESVDKKVFEVLMSSALTPVLACVGVSLDGQVFNINADTVAGAVAVSLRARRLLMVTGRPGVLRDPKDLDSRWTHLSVEQAQAAIRAGTIGGGMIPKMEESIRALRGGVQQVFVLGHLEPGTLQRAIEKPGSIGTVLHD